MKKRLEFQCWQCEETYTLQRNVGEGKPVLSVACPYCGAEATVDLAPYKKRIDEVYRSKDRQVISAGDWVYDLPATLPTKPLE